MISATRRQKTEKIIKKRLKQFEQCNPYYSGLKQEYRKPAREPHRLHKESQLGHKKPTKGLYNRPNEHINEEEYE